MYKIKNIEKLGFIFRGFVGGCVFILILAQIFSTADSEIKSGKEFIIENATYKCTKTNELLEGK